MGKVKKLTEEWIPLVKPKIYHSRLLAKPYMEEPCAGKLLAGVCGGAGRQRTALPGTKSCMTRLLLANYGNDVIIEAKKKGLNFLIQFHKSFSLTIFTIQNISNI
jgi:hypothetical protein